MIRSQLPRTEEAWYVVNRRNFPIDYWSATRQNWAPWIAGDEAEAYGTEEKAKQVAVAITFQFPSLAGTIGVLKRS